MQYDTADDLGEEPIAEIEATELDLREDLLGNLFSCCQYDI